MLAEETKRPLKTDDQHAPNERGDKFDARCDAAERPVEPSAAERLSTVQQAAAERPATRPTAAANPFSPDLERQLLAYQRQLAAAEQPATRPTAAANPFSPDLERQLLAYQRQLAEIGQHAKALDGILAERDRKAAMLRQQLAASQAEAERLRSELHTLRETYRCVGRGALAVANQFDSVKRGLPITLRNVLQRGR